MMSTSCHQSVAIDLLMVFAMTFQIYLAHQTPSTSLLNCLQANGLQYRLFDSALDLWNAVQRNAPPELILAHMLLPDRTGLWLCQQLKSHPSLHRTPVVLMGQSHDAHNRIMSMECGAEDHVSANIAPEELVLRIQRILLRTQLSIRPTKWLHIGPFQIFEDSQQLYCGETEIFLTPKEYQLFMVLCQANGALLSRRHLLKTVWEEKLDLQSRILDTYIKRLRKKLGTHGSLIETIHGKGYRLTHPSTPLPNLTQA